ncbi:ficolin-2-like [Mercenaria mercenaria]|uniref:ficolin-2-like n=1 Tax=Mercenaria mercenaria TaxID=6596 RepID=UPI00234EC667|nr:ficolin-2-like [Mercenaria mercenaria]
MDKTQHQIRSFDGEVIMSSIPWRDEELMSSIPWRDEELFCYLTLISELERKGAPLQLQSTLASGQSSGTATTKGPTDTDASAFFQMMNNCEFFRTDDGDRLYEKINEETTPEEAGGSENLVDLLSERVSAITYQDAKKILVSLCSSIPKEMKCMKIDISESSCKEISENNSSSRSGLYEIKLLKSKKAQTVYCDMDTDGGGWTVFQNRFDFSVDFNRNFSEYENGFGDLNGEFWLGLKIVQEMTYQGTTEFRLDVTTVDDDTLTETYQNFYLDKGPEYTLHIGTPGSARTKLVYNNGQHFTTYDFDQDSNSRANCASRDHGAWWHNVCTRLTLNGYRMSYGGTISEWLQLKTTKMMFR